MVGQLGVSAETAGERGCGVLLFSQSSYIYIYEA